MSSPLSEAELERIREEIARCEAGTSGEIVPYVVERSDRYEVVLWRAAAATGSVFLLVALLVYLFYEGWSLAWLYTGIGLGTWLSGGFLFGPLLAMFVRPVFLLFAGRSLVAGRVRNRAQRAFLEEGVFRTAGRTGILIFVSLWEHRIQVLADAGVAERVPTDTWSEVVEAVRVPLKQGRLADGLIDGITACGKVLRKAGLTAEEGDQNELDDAVKFRKD